MIIERINIKFPGWIEGLNDEHELKKELYNEIKDAFNNTRLIKDINNGMSKIAKTEIISKSNIEEVNLGNGSINVDITLQENLFYKVLTEITGVDVNDEAELFGTIAKLSETKKHYDKVSMALEEVKQKGYEDVSSNMDYKYADGDELVFTGGFIQKNLNANKSIWIEREIGQRPVLAFGNSGSDTSMMNYVLDKRNPYRSKAYMVVADDDVREWGTQNWEEKSAQYEEQGYVPISMKNDFLKIYPDTIKKADEQYVEPEEEEGAA